MTVTAVRRDVDALTLTITAEYEVPPARVPLERTDGGGTRMVIESTFASREAMERLVSMCMEEEMRAALGQTDGILAGDLV